MLGRARVVQCVWWLGSANETLYEHSDQCTPWLKWSLAMNINFAFITSFSPWCPYLIQKRIRFLFVSAFTEEQSTAQKKGPPCHKGTDRLWCINCRNMDGTNMCSNCLSQEENICEWTHCYNLLHIHYPPTDDEETDYWLLFFFQEVASNIFIDRDALSSPHIHASAHSTSLPSNSSR